MEVDSSAVDLSKVGQTFPVIFTAKSSVGTTTSKTVQVTVTSANRAPQIRYATDGELEEHVNEEDRNLV